MKNVAVSELKARLSEYLSQVKEGVRLVVTDRGKPIAEILAYGSVLNLDDTDAVEARLQKLAQQGSLRRPKKHAPFPKIKNRPKLPGNTASELLLKDRK